ncbi:GDP-mannose mannosyl hydrolase [Mangrovitalea sediminis]|uniref:GDP-mannose mannosyl hydrolase n=1 Tax=Mangrovitalea sediminis TaxID=1982043 RepID=UPI000BE531A1|nr:GDP-mannose mannosyl hydrolase [Mangrovitalea sediminis]
MAERSAWLDAATFKTVVSSTPLVSIDFLVENERGEYLLGRRKNRPAQGNWFVPGGRVRKNESLDIAFKRLTGTELGVELERTSAEFKGVYEHFYRDSIFGLQVSTHYIVMAYKVRLHSDFIQLDVNQHENMLLVKPEHLEQYDVHRHTLDYFYGTL